ncbi:MAG: GntR family transcriptional regulator [Nitratireductor sp.]|jgi:DNA-binding GntR family transcriptional regulator|nr:GntR family transcriptional regulator [Nitratireductor sp.]
MADAAVLDNDHSAERMSQTQRAIQQLREMIISNKLLPGSNHLEAELAEFLGMSRTPVREAAVVLEGQGLVEVKPRRGIRILPISPADLEEVYAILTELESLSAWQIARQGIAREDLDVLRDCIEEMEDALETGDRMRWANADDMFHRKLASLSGNRRLESIVATYSDQVHRARMLTLHIRPAPHSSNADHRALVAAIEAGEADKAREIHRRHRTAGKEQMISLIASHGFMAL